LVNPFPYLFPKYPSSFSTFCLASNSHPQSYSMSSTWSCAIFDFLVIRQLIPQRVAQHSYDEVSPSIQSKNSSKCVEQVWSFNFLFFILSKSITVMQNFAKSPPTKSLHPLISLLLIKKEKKKEELCKNYIGNKRVYWSYIHTHTPEKVQ
jgi:hypothetical protein